MGWFTGLAHWASGLPMGLNNNGLGRSLARWATGFLGRAVGQGLFDDPYPFQSLIMLHLHMKNL